MNIQLLPHSRWSELDRAFKDSRSDEPLPKPEHSIMLAAMDNDRVVGCIGVEKVWLISPFWVEKEHRGSGLARELVANMARELVENLAPYNIEAFREVCVTTSPHVDRLVYSIGFIPIEGQIWRRDGK